MKLNLSSDTKIILRIFLIWRFALFIPVIAGFYLLDYGSSVPFFEVSYYHHNLISLFDNYLFEVWANFDGVHYFNIAVDGYVNQARFFPLLSILLYLISLDLYLLNPAYPKSGI